MTNNRTNLSSGSAYTDIKKSQLAKYEENKLYLRADPGNQVVKDSMLINSIALQRPIFLYVQDFSAKCLKKQKLLAIIRTENFGWMLQKLMLWEINLKELQINIRSQQGNDYI